MTDRLTPAEWVAKQVAVAPPLTQQQQAELRRLLLRPAPRAKKPA